MSDESNKGLWHHMRKEKVHRKVETCLFDQNIVHSVVIVFVGDPM